MKAELARCERMLSTSVAFQVNGCGNMDRVAAVIRARAVRMMLERSGITPNGTAREPCSIRRANLCKMSTSATQIEISLGCYFTTFEVEMSIFLYH